MTPRKYAAIEAVRQQARELLQQAHAAHKQASDRMYVDAINTIVNGISKDDLGPQDYSLVMQAYSGMMAHANQAENLLSMRACLSAALDYHYNKASQDCMSAENFNLISSLLVRYLREKISYLLKHTNMYSGAEKADLKKFIDELKDVAGQYVSRFGRGRCDDSEHRQLANIFHHLSCYYHNISEHDNELQYALYAIDHLVQISNADKQASDISLLANIYAELSVMKRDDALLSELMALAAEFFSGGKNCYFGRLQKITDELSKPKHKSSEKARALLCVFQTIDAHRAHALVPDTTLKTELSSLYYRSSFTSLFVKQNEIVERYNDAAMSEAVEVIAALTHDLGGDNGAVEDVGAGIAALAATEEKKPASVATGGVFNSKGKQNRVGAIVKDFDARKISYVRK